MMVNKKLVKSISTNNLITQLINYLVKNTVLSTTNLKLKAFGVVYEVQIF